jgi:hypothetical protein
MDMWSPGQRNFAAQRSVIISTPLKARQAGPIARDSTDAHQHRMIELGPDKFLASLTAKSGADVDELQSEMQLKP